MKTETLHCEPGGHDWQRPVIRARKPRACPEHGGPAIPTVRTAPRPATMLREDINDRRETDRGRNAIDLRLLRLRLAAVERAELHSTEQGPWELRQMLVDLAAAAEEWASTLPAPGVLTVRQQLRRERAAA